MFTNDPIDPEFSDRPGPKPIPAPRGFRLVDLLAVLGSLGLLAILIIPASRSARPAARRAQCTNNLKQIALALHTYEQKYGCLPPAFTVDAHGRPLHSWRTLILPYLEQQALYDRIDLSRPWNDSANAAALRTTVGVYHCPEDTGPPNRTTYLAIVGPSAGFLPTSGRALADITDAASDTLLVIEAGDQSAVPWMAPLDADEALVLSLGASSRLHHRSGMIASMADASVRFIPAATGAGSRRALVSIAGGEGPQPPGR